MRRWYSNRAMTWADFWVGLIAACVILPVVMVWRIPQVENPPSIFSGLRGKTVIIFRLPSRPGEVQQFWLQDDGSVVRGNIESGPRRDGQLTPIEWQAVNTLRETWCASYPHFSASRNPDVYYEIGMCCGAPSDLTFEQIHIPTDQLPAPLVTVLSRIPAP